MRFDREAIPKRLILHTGFLNSSLISDDSGFSHFAITVRIVNAEALVRDAIATTIAGLRAGAAVHSMTNGGTS
jgi:hypothetical protein